MERRLTNTEILVQAAEGQRDQSMKQVCGALKESMDALQDRIRERAPIQSDDLRGIDFDLPFEEIKGDLRYLPIKKLNRFLRGPEGRTPKHLLIGLGISSEVSRLIIGTEGFHVGVEVDIRTVLLDISASRIEFVIDSSLKQNRTKILIGKDFLFKAHAAIELLGWISKQVDRISTVETANSVPS